jgi:hypothetical protein
MASKCDHLFTSRSLNSEGEEKYVKMITDNQNKCEIYGFEVAIRK